jgi:hypothetical protein
MKETLACRDRPQAEDGKHFLCSSESRRRHAGKGKRSSLVYVQADGECHRGVAGQYAEPTAPSGSARWHLQVRSLYARGCVSATNGRTTSSATFTHAKKGDNSRWQNC